MINKIIEFSAENKFLVFLFIGVAAVLGWQAMKDTKLDAIPDLSDTQVIVYAKWDRSPDIMEDQVTYPITSALLGMPKVKDMRGFSDFGYSYIYIIFDEGTDIYWARSRTLEYLNAITPRLPQGVSVELAKDATAVGWVYQYALVDDSGQIQPRPDALLPGLVSALRPAGRSRRGRGGAAGGFVREYQVNIDPNKLPAYKTADQHRRGRHQKSNNDVGGRLVEFPAASTWCAGAANQRSLDDIGNIVLLANPQTERRCGWRRGYGHLRPRHAARRYRAGRQRRSRWRRGHHALRRKRAEGHRARQIEDPRYQANAAARGCTLSTLYDRSELIDRSDRQPESTR